MRLFLSIHFLIFSQFIFAQAPVKELLEQNWRIIPSYSNKNKSLEQSNVRLSSESDGNFNRSRVVLSPTEQVVLISYNNTDYGVMLITEELKIKWNTPLSGLTLGIGKYKDKILVVHTGDMNKKDYWSQINATILDPVSGKKIMTKTILNAPTDFLFEPKLFFTPDHQEFFLGVRYTETENKARIFVFGAEMGNFTEKYSKTPKFELLSFNENLEEIRRIALPAKKGFNFVQAEMSKKKELLIMYYEGDGSFGIQLIADNFIDVKDYRRISVDLRENDNFNMSFSISGVDFNIIHFTITYQNAEKDRATAVYRINLNDKIVKSVSIAYNKEFRKKMKEKYKPYNKKADNLSTSEWDEMEIGDLIEFEDKVICFTEVQLKKQHIRSTNAMSQTTITGDGILSVYDKNLTLIDQQIIPKYIEYFGSEGVYTSLFVHDQILSMVSGVRTGSFSTLPMIIDYNLKQNKITRQDIPERGSVSKSPYITIDPSCTLWFQKSFVISYRKEKGAFTAKRRETDMQKFFY